MQFQDSKKRGEKGNAISYSSPSQGMQRNPKSGCNRRTAKRASIELQPGSNPEL